MSILLAMKILLHEHLDVRASSLYVRACVRHEHLATFGPSGCWLQWSHRQCVSDVCLYTYLYIYDVCLYTYVYHIYSLHADQPVQGHVARTRLPRCTCEIPRCSHELQVPIRARSLSLLSLLSSLSHPLDSLFSPYFPLAVSSCSSSSSCCCARCSLNAAARPHAAAASDRALCPARVVIFSFPPTKSVRRRRPSCQYSRRYGGHAVAAALHHSHTFTVVLLQGRVSCSLGRWCLCVAL